MEVIAPLLSPVIIIAAAFLVVDAIIRVFAASSDAVKAEAEEPQRIALTVYGDD